MSNLGYRADIDGLRAVAVLSVILFHVGVPFMTGGYVGVDVFFVISGFLITSLILKDLKAGEFSFAGFWERRARRILPALGVVMFASLVAGWFLLLPDDYASLGKEIVAQSVFGSNILFYKQAGYFDVDSHLKPLLHTWSLAVEEQFYIFFPLVTVFVWKKFNRYFFPFLIISAISSFALCALVMHNESLAFYMLPFRGWELLGGSILAFMLRTPKQTSQSLREAVSLAGLAAIMVPVFLYSKETPFPGYGALPPVLGAAALIWANAGASTLVGKILSWRPVVFVGLVSYSWYLWHWPAIVFVKYNPFITFDFALGASIVAGTFLLSILTWKYVETPFRRFTCFLKRRSLYAAAGTMLVCFIGLGLWLIGSGGFPARLDPATVKYAQGITDDNPHRKFCDKTPVAWINSDRVCQTNEGAADQSFLVWGDSLGDALAPAFFDLSKKHGRNGYVATHHGCPPIVDYALKEWQGNSDCVAFNHAVRDFIKRKNIKTVYLVAGWLSWFNYAQDEKIEKDWVEPAGGIHKNMGASALQRMTDSLKADGVKVYVVIDAPSAGFDPPRTLAIGSLYGHEANAPLYPREIYLKGRATFLDAYLEKARGVTFIDPLDFMCPKEYCIVEKDGYSLYYNSGHISVHGAQHLIPLLEPYF